ncbi:MAG: 16S rRNA (guanine(966)-N(2))-methyltransferase RsmD [Candidatus Cloacimonadota bacterium]|nr:MAG: 16S rRNA (guanine(966)-N(2))-methyltransferase RsmD [Candidatus Cloacimonadota bacterium]
MLQISSGELKKMNIKTPSGDRIRPTKSSVREAIFSMIGYSIQQRTFLDLCAGTGAMGLEALSRGACLVSFVEKDRKVGEILKDNVADAEDRMQDFDISLRVYQESFSVFLKRDEKFDFVYFDPPYIFYRKHKLDEYDFDSLVCDGGMLFMEHTRHDLRPVPEKLGSLYLVETRKYGSCKVSVFKKP